jgi:protein TonB
VLGLVAFLLVWRTGSDRDEFYRAGPAAPTAAIPQYAPLPVPIAAGSDDDVSDVPISATRTGDEEEKPRLVETAPPPPVAVAPKPRPLAPGSISQPQAISTPSPKYPAQALRKGEQGTVMVSAEIGVDGVPSSVEVARSSGSRPLDRAAVDAVKRWRFRPAMADGRPTPGRVQVPINFKN